MKKISTKIYISMFALTLAVLAFVGAALILSKTLDYYKDFEQTVTAVFDRPLPEDTDELYEYVKNEYDVICLGSRKEVYILERGNIVKSTAKGGTIRMTDTLESVISGGFAKRPNLTSDALDYAVRTGEDTVLYMLDTRADLYAYIRELTVLFLQALVLGILLAALCGYFISKKLTRPIQKLTDGARRMSEGEFVTVECGARDEIGNLCGVFNDMSRQIKSDFAQFERVEQSRREFVANVSHELKTPLTVIKSYSETLMNMDVDEATRRKFLAVISDETERMSDIVGQLLTISGLKAPAAAENSVISLAPVCQSILSAQSIAIENKGITASVTGDAKIVSDMQKVSAILTNLITNAVKYTENDGKIAVTITDGEHPSVTVWDDGIGIANEDIPHLFERFYRTDKARGRETGGSGLGLAIAKQCADAIGANITVRSELHKFTEFEVTF